MLITNLHNYRSYLNLPIKGCPNWSLNVFDAKDELFGGFGVEIPTKFQLLISYFWFTLKWISSMAATQHCHFSFSLALHWYVFSFFLFPSWKNVNLWFLIILNWNQSQLDRAHFYKKALKKCYENTVRYRGRSLSSYLVPFLPVCLFNIDLRNKAC